MYTRIIIEYISGLSEQVFPGAMPTQRVALPAGEYHGQTIHDLVRAQPGKIIAVTARVRAFGRARNERIIQFDEGEGPEKVRTGTQLEKASLAVQRATMKMDKDKI